MIDLQTIAYLRTVPIGEDEFKAIVAEHGLETVEGEAFAIRSDDGTRLYPNEIWDKIPEDAVWLEETFSWDDPSWTYCCLRKKVDVLYRFKRHNDELIRHIEEPTETEWRQLELNFHGDDDLPF